MKRSAERDETENPKKAKNEDAIELDSDDSGDFGPALPGVDFYDLKLLKKLK